MFRPPPRKIKIFVLGRYICRPPPKTFHLVFELVTVPSRGHSRSEASGDLLKANGSQTPPKKLKICTWNIYVPYPPLQIFHQKHEIRYSDTPPNISNICTGPLYRSPPPPNISPKARNSIFRHPPKHYKYLYLGHICPNPPSKYFTFSLNLSQYPAGGIVVMMRGERGGFTWIWSASEARPFICIFINQCFITATN